MTVGRPQRLRGVLVRFNRCPQGAYDALLLCDGDALWQVNFPPHLADAIAAAVPVNAPLAVEAVEIDSRGDHAVFEMLHLATAAGPLDVPRRPPRPPRPEPGQRAFARLSGRIAHLNYTREGEAEGVVLEDGAYVHLGPHAFDALQLTAGQPLDVCGMAHRTADGRQAIERPTLVNGKKLPHPPPPPRGREPRRRRPE